MDTIKRTGKYFEVGKTITDRQGIDFGLTAEEADAGIAGFTPKPINYHHMPTFFDGRMGEVSRLWRDGKNVMAEYTLPQWMLDATGGVPLTVSSEWDISTKTPIGAAITLTPALSDAIMLGAAAQFTAEFSARHNTPEGQRQMQSLHDDAARYGAVCTAPGAAVAQMSSAHESKGIQQIHDMTIKHGAKCASGDATRVYYSEASIDPIDAHVTPPSAVPGSDHTPPKGKPMTNIVRDGIKALFSRFGDNAPSDAEIDAVAEHLKPGTNPADAAKIAELERKLGELQTGSAAQFTASVQQQAEAFADQIIREERALPRERPHIIAQYVTNAEDDKAVPRTVKFSKHVTKKKADGSGDEEVNEEATGTRLDCYKASFAARPKASWTQEMMAGSSPVALFGANMSKTDEDKLDQQIDKAVENYGKNSNVKETK